MTVDGGRLIGDKRGVEEIQLDRATAGARDRQRHMRLRLGREKEQWMMRTSTR